MFEVFQRMDDAPPTSCEVCGEEPIERVLHPVAVHFKGSGFYTTDYGRGSSRKVKETEGSSSGAASSQEKHSKESSDSP